MSYNDYRTSSPDSQEPPHSSASIISLNGPVCLPGNALSFLQSCGLDSTDLAQLAKLPESLITVEALPDLLLQIREQKRSGTLSSSSSTSRKLDSSSFDREDDRKSTKYPLNESPRSAFPLPRDQVQSWQDRWGNPRKTGCEVAGSSAYSGTSSRVLDRSRSRDNGEQYYSKQVYSSAASDSSTDSHSYMNSDPHPRPLLSLSIDPPHKVPTRKEASDFLGKVPPVFPYACILCNITALSEQDWIIHIRGTLHANSQFNLLQKYPKWDQTVQSARRNKNLPTMHSFSDTGGFRVPTKSESSAFQGRIPLVFPYVCVLCDITVLSEKEWSLHISGVLHAKSQLKLLEKYPEWNQSYESSRYSDVDVRRESHRSRNGSPSPKRRRSSDKTCSSNGHRSKEKDDSRHSKERSSTKKSSLSSHPAASHEVNSHSPGHERRRFSSFHNTRESKNSSRSSSSPATHESKKSAQDSESDLEGMEVIADDGKELPLECKEQEPEELAEVSAKLEDDVDFPENFNNCITLDELLEETCFDWQDEPIAPIFSKTEVTSDKVTETVKDPIPTYTDPEPSHNEPQQSINPEVETTVKTDCSDDVQTNPDQLVEEHDHENVTDSIEEALTNVTTSPSTTTNSEQSLNQPEMPKQSTIVAETRSSGDVPNTVLEGQEIKTFTNGIQETFGKVLEVRNLPKEEDYTDLDLIKIITRYGHVRHHVLFRSHKRGFVEMENACDAERVAADADKQDVALRGNVLMIKVSKKYSSLLAEAFSDDSEDEENNQTQSDASSGNTNSEPSSDAAMNQPVGTEFVRPVVGYFCNLCNVIYASEEEAKDEHCRTPAHREKVKEHKAKNGSA